MPDDTKQRLVALLKQHDIPLIEDDVFGELPFGPKRARTCKSYDDSGLVLFCSSFSKTLAPGYRVGWVVPGRYYHAVRMAKLTHTLATATLPELAIAGFLAEGGYDHWLRSVRTIYKDNVTRMRRAILEEFPAGTTVHDRVRFDEVSLGYPREWGARGRPDPLARQILPAPELPQVRWIRGDDGMPRIARPGDTGPDLEEER